MAIKDPDTNEPQLGTTEQGPAPLNQVKDNRGPQDPVPLDRCEKLLIAREALRAQADTLQNANNMHVDQIISDKKAIMSAQAEIDNARARLVQSRSRLARSKEKLQDIQDRLSEVEDEILDYASWSD